MTPEQAASNWLTGAEAADCLDQVHQHGQVIAKALKLAYIGGLRDGGSLDRSGASFRAKAYHHSGALIAVLTASEKLATKCLDELIDKGIATGGHVERYDDTLGWLMCVADGGRP
jgi:hypothetical protein